MSALTKLKNQLIKLQTPQTSLYLPDSNKESFIYDSAKSIDLDTHYSIALSGLNEIISIDSTCNRFLESPLFKETSKSIDRSILNEADKNELDYFIKDFLFKVVSPYFLMNATRKTIEWLVVKFKIHKFNVQELLFATLPYHETNYFTRLIQICDLKLDKNTNFYWLESLKTTRTSLVKTILFNNLSKHTIILRDFINQLIKLSSSDNDYDNELWISFLTSTLISILDKNGINENILLITLQYVDKCFKLSSSSLTISAYLILAYISANTKLVSSTLESILKEMRSNYKRLKTIKPKNEFIYCLSTICLHQNLDKFSNKLTDLIIQENLINDCDFKISKLISAIVNNLAIRIDETNLKLILELLSLIQPDYETINLLIKTIVKNNSDENDENRIKIYTELMKLLERRYPNQFDLSIENLDQNAVAKILNSNLYLKLKNGNISLVNAINNPNLKIRLASLNLLKELDDYEQLDLNSKEIIYNSIKIMFMDLDEKLLIKLLDIEFLDKILNKQDLVNISTNLFKKSNQNNTEEWYKIKNNYFNLLIKLEYDDQQFLNIFTRFLFPINENQLNQLNCLLESESIKKLEYVQHLNSKLDQLKLKKKVKLDNILELMFKSTAEFNILNLKDQSFLEKLINNHEKDNFNLICALIINDKILKKTATYQEINDCVNKSINLLEQLCFKSNLKLTNFKEEDQISEINLFKTQLKLIDQNKLIVEFLVILIEKFIESIEFNVNELNENDQKFYVNSIFNLLCNLVNKFKSETSSEKFKFLLNNFIDKCKPFNYEYLTSLWINDDPLLQARSLAIYYQILNCGDKKKNELTEFGILNLFIALSSTSIEIRKLALQVLLASDLNSNDLINLAVKNSNEYQLSNTAISKVLKQKDESFLKLAIEQLDDPLASFNLKYGLLKIISKEFTVLFSLLKSLNNLSSHLLNKKEELTIKENEMLAIIFTIYCNYFSDIKNNILQLNELNNDKLNNNKLDDIELRDQKKIGKIAIQTFCRIMEHNNCIKEFAYDKLKKKWIFNLESNSLIVSIINTLLNDFLSTGNEKAKSKLINFLIDGLTVTYLINYYTISPTSSKMTNNQLTDHQKMKKQSIEERLQFDADNLNWKKVLILLEIMQSKNEITNSTQLLKCIFSLLKECLRTEEKASIEYLKQLILFNIRNCLEQTDCDVQCFEIELIFKLMKCLRLKASQTAVLTILNIITPYFKKEILDNFMLIFTYLGTNIIGINNEYEMKLVDDTLNTIIPCLLEENDKNKNQITDAFIDALADIPSHRLVHIFSKLIKLYSTENSLWYVLFKLDIRTIREDLFGELEFLDFTQQLISLFNISINLNTMVNIAITSIKILDCNFIFGSNTITKKESAKLNLLLAKQLNLILDSDVFLNQISFAEWKDVNFDIKNLVEQLISLINKLEKLNDNKNDQLYDTICNSLIKVNNLLPLEEFADILQHLLNNGLQSNYQKTLKVFIKKLSVNSTSDISYQTWLNFFSSLISIIKKCSTNQDDEECLITGQYAFVALKIISKHLEHNESLRPQLIESIEITLQITDQLNLDQPKVFNLFVSGVLCLSKLACVIKNQAIPFISKILQLILKAFNRNTDLVNLSCFAVLAKLTKIFPTYLGSFLPDILIKISSLIKRREKLPELDLKLTLVENNITELVPFRKLIEILFKTYKRMTKTIECEQLIHLLKFAENSFKQLDKKPKLIEENIKSINEFLFKIIDFRNDNSNKLKSIELNKIEQSSLSILCTFLPKLKESKFKLFIKNLYEWATNTDSKNRLQTFYTLTNRLADNVKEMFTLFVTPVIAPNCLKLLSKEMADNKEIEDEQKHSIVINVLRTIYKSIHYNINILTSKDIEKFIDLIINQLDYNYGFSSHYEERIKDGVSKCVQSLVKGFDDFQMIKSLQLKILDKTKDKNKVKKLYALHVLHQFVLANTEEYVTYLPDAVPYLVELYEDDSEDIQRLLVETFRDIEYIINEPISNYL